MIAAFRPQPNTRSVFQPEPPLLCLFHWHFQPLSPPQSLDALVVNLPTSISQQRRDPTIAVSTILPGQLDHVGHQPLFVWATDRCFALRGPMLSQDAAGSSL